MLQNDGTIGNYMDRDDLVWDAGDNAFNPWMNNSFRQRRANFARAQWPYIQGV